MIFKSIFKFNDLTCVVALMRKHNSLDVHESVTKDSSMNKL